MPNFRRIFTLLASLLVAPLGAVAQAQAATTYYFSPVNQYGINLTAAYWNPIVNYVSEKSGVKLALKIGRTSADTTSYVLAREVDFTFTNHLFSPERQQLGWKVFGRRKTPPLHGQIVVRADSGITALSQLAGQDVAFPGPEALISYKMPYAHLLSRDIAIEVVFGGNMDGALAQLFSGQVKAVGGNSQLIEGYARREKHKVRVLWTSEPVYDLALMVAPKVPEPVVKAVTAAFLQMGKDPRGQTIIRQVSKLVELPEDAHFIASNGSEYGAYYDFYKTAPPALR